MLIYLDTNIYCRPFDDQRQLRVRGEALAFVMILRGVETKEIDLLKSEVLEFEIAQVKNEERRNRLRSYLQICSADVRATDEQLFVAQRLEQECHLKGRDALHVAAACLGRASYFVTCDDAMLKQADCCAKITGDHLQAVTLVGPEEFVKLFDETKRGETR